MAKKAMKKSAKPAATRAVKKVVKKTATKAAKRETTRTLRRLATAADAGGGGASPDPHRMLPLLDSLDTLRAELAPIDPDNAGIQAIIDAIDALKAVLHCQGGQTFPPAP